LSEVVAGGSEEPIWRSTRKNLWGFLEQNGREGMLRRLFIATAVIALVAFSIVGIAVAGATGQPNQSCETTPTTPGSSSNARGSAFNPDGVAGTKYAGEQAQNSKNPNSVSQYDVACSKQPSR
jgi:hypothetical protein